MKEWRNKYIYVEKVADVCNSSCPPVCGINAFVCVCVCVFFIVFTLELFYRCSYVYRPFAKGTTCLFLVHDFFFISVSSFV